MNWQAVKAAPGQFVKLQVVITEIKHMNSDFGPYALGKAQDGPGQVEQVLFTVGKGKEFPTGLAVNHFINCAGRYDANTQKMKVFFDSMAQTQAPPPNSYPPQQPPVARQPANAPQPTRDATGVSIERQCVVKGVMEKAARSQLTIAETIEWCCALHKWVSDGLPFGDGSQMAPPTQPSGTNPNYVGDNPPPPKDDDIPFS